MIASLQDLPLDEIASARELIDVDEYEIALENLIVQIVELHIQVDGATQEAFREVAWKLNLDPSYFRIVEAMILRRSVT